MKKAFKIIALTVALLIAAVMAVSCGVDYTEDDIKKEAARLIEGSYEINEIYFGKGLPISEEDSEDAKNFAEENGLELENIQFLPVNEESPYKSIEDIKKAAAKVYSKSYCDYLNLMAFEGYSVNNGNAAVYAKYIEDEKGVLTARIDLAEKGIDLNRTYDISTVKVKKMKKDEATITVQSLVDNKEDQVLTFKLVRDEDGWRLDTPTY